MKEDVFVVLASCTVQQQKKVPYRIQQKKVKNEIQKKKLKKLTKHKIENFR